VSVLAVWTMEQIGAQRRCTTGCKLPVPPQLVGAKLSRWSRTGKKARRMPPKVNWSRTASPLLCTDGQSVSMSVRLGADWLAAYNFDLS
jgi:hypothetical protein